MITEISSIRLLKIWESTQMAIFIYELATIYLWIWIPESYISTPVGKMILIMMISKATGLLLIIKSSPEPIYLLFFISISFFASLVILLYFHTLRNKFFKFFSLHRLFCTNIKYKWISQFFQKTTYSVLSNNTIFCCLFNCKSHLYKSTFG